MITREEINTVLADGRVVIGEDGHDLGLIGQVLPDGRTSDPAWMTVTSDTWNGAQLVVPLRLARLVDGRVQVPYTSAVVEGAPRRGRFVGYLERQHEEDLARHYGLDPDVASGGRLQFRRAWQLLCAASSVRVLRRELRPLLDATGLPSEELDDLVLAACEAATNAIEHPGLSTTGYFDVLVEIDGVRVQVTVRDYGRWRNPTPRGDPGRGLLLMRNLSALTITVEPSGTTVVLQNRSADLGRLIFRRRR